MSSSAKWLVAHRGFSSRYAENTLASVRGALRAGARFVEIDVQLTADYVPVVYHDPTLRRVSRVRGDIRRLRYSQLKGLKPAHPISPLSALAPLFKAHRGARLFVELKEESLKPFGRLEMLAAVDTALAPIRKQCILISFDREALSLAKRLTKYPLGFVIRRFADLKSAYFRSLKPDFVFSGTQMLPRRGSLKAGRSKHCIYEVPDPAVAESLRGRGVDMIETFAIDNYL